MKNTLSRSEATSDQKSKKDVDWSALIRLIYILIKFLFKVVKDQKKNAKH